MAALLIAHFQDPWGLTTWYAKAKCELGEGHRLTRSSSRKETSPWIQRNCPPRNCWKTARNKNQLDSLTIHVLLYVYLNLVGFYGKCTVGKYKYNVWILWGFLFNIPQCSPNLQTCFRVTAARWRKPKGLAKCRSKSSGCSRSRQNSRHPDWSVRRWNWTWDFRMIMYPPTESTNMTSSGRKNPPLPPSLKGPDKRMPFVSASCWISFNCPRF